MRGKTHYKIAMLTCAIAATVPIINSSTFLHNKVITVPRGISIAALGVSAIAALIVDADSQHSKINHINPATAAANEAIDFVGGLLKTIIRLVIGLGLGVTVFKYSKLIIAELSAVNQIGHYATIITYLAAFLLIFSAVTSERIIGKIPIVGGVYRLISVYISAGESVLKRAAMFLVYAGSGIFLIIYNMKHTHDPYLYLIGCLLIVIPIFPHRTFLHSFEGIVVVTISASYLFNKIGYENLKYAFLIGYASHLYLADILTKEGVPISVMPFILKKIGVHKLLENNKVYSIIYNVLNIRLVIPIMSTGSIGGNIFEEVYVVALFLLAIMMYVKYGGGIRLV